jgi:hypothetical protein
MTGRNPWAVLGVAEDATYLEVQRAYRRRVKQTHPDSGGDAGEFATVVHAFDVVRRARPPQPRHPPAGATPYDSWLSPTRSTRSWTEGPCPTRPAPSTAGSSWATLTGPTVGADFPAVLRREMSRTGALVPGH